MATIGVGGAPLGARPSRTAERAELDARKARFCQVFLDTHVPYDASAVTWPDLDDTDREVLAGLPIWDEAVNTELETAERVRMMAAHEPDPTLAEALALQAFEEERHSVLVAALTRAYGIPVQRRPRPRMSDPTFEFVRAGWGESIDSFFAFGVFAVARDAELAPAGLLQLFDRVMQEEARHILFFENWRRYRRASSPTLGALWQAVSGSLAVGAVVADRLRMAAGAPRDGGAVRENFVMAGARTLSSLSPRAFVDICLSENDRRLSVYDSDLRRPDLVPAVARTLRRFLPQSPPRQAPDRRAPFRAWADEP